MDHTVLPQIKLAFSLGVDSDLRHVFSILNARRKTSILRAKISSSGQYETDGTNLF